MEKMTMRDYIEETPEVSIKNIGRYKQLVEPIIKYIGDKKINRIWLIASGSSYNSCHCARFMMMKTMNIEVKIISPYTFTYYENDIKDDDLVMVVSQSGLSTNAIEALQKIKKLNKTAICLTGNIDNDCKNYAEIIVDYGVGEELVGYVCKGVTTLALFLMLLSVEISGKVEWLPEIEKAIKLHPLMQKKALEFIEKHYKSFSSMQQIYFCGGGSQFGTALEGALKVGETVHIPSNAYEVEEYIHGPNLQLTPMYTVVLLDANDEASNRVKQVYLASREVSDRVFLLSDESSLIDDDNVLSIGETVLPELAPLVYLPFVQLLSHIISSDLLTTKQHPLLKKFKLIASAKTDNFVNYDGDE